jgi:glutamate 5-kinase
MVTLVVKLGSSTVVDVDGRPRGRLLRERVSDLVSLRRAGHRPVLVSSGAVSSGRAALRLPKGRLSLPDQQAASSVGQALLFERYRGLFATSGLVPAQVLLTSSDLERRDSYLNARNALERLLELGALPIVNENDATATEELTVGDNDRLAAHVAILIGADLLLLLTDRPGVLGGDSDRPRLIAEVMPDADPADLPIASLEGSGVGRGGIRAKVEAAMLAAQSGITAIIASGEETGVMSAVADGRPAGTRFAPASPDGAAMRGRRELERLAIAWLADLLVPRDAVELALGTNAIGWRRVHAGEVVFRRGDPGDAMYLIVGGELEVLDPNEREPVAVLGPGRYVGEMALLGEPARTATVRSRRSASLLVVPADAFANLVDRVPELGDRLRSTIAERRT